MKNLMPVLLALIFFFSGPNIEAACKSPPQGPQGPFATNYIDSYNNTPQILVPNTPANVIFPSNSVDPVGITKSGINDSFTVDQSGVYLIAFAVNVSSVSFMLPPNLISLTLKVDNAPIPPLPMAAATQKIINPTDKFELTGQTLLTLAQGQTVTLEVLPSFTLPNESMQIDSALFTIVQVDSAP